MGLGAAGTAAAIGAAGAIGSSAINASGGGGGGGGGATPATSTNAPWAGVQPYLTDSLQQAQNLYQMGGPQYYPGQTYAPQNGMQSGGINALSGISSMFAPLYGQISGTAGNLISGTGANNPSNSIYGNIANSSAGNNPSNAFYTGLSNQSAASNPSTSFFQGLTNGTGPGLSTLNDYASGKYLSADNQYFQQMANTVKANVLPGINAQFANAGRGSSGLAARAASEGLGDSIGGLAYNNYQQGLGQQQNAANSLANYGIQGAQGLSSNYQTNLANQAVGAQGLSSNYQSNIANQALGAQGLSQNYQNNVNNQISGTNMASLLQSLGINAGQAGLTAGNAQQALDQQPIDASMAQFNYNQNLPYQNLQQYIQNISGNPAAKSSTTTSTPAQASFWDQGLSGALSGAQLYNQFGGGSSGYDPGYTSGLLQNISIPNQSFTSTRLPGLFNGT